MVCYSWFLYIKNFHSDLSIDDWIANVLYFFFLYRLRTKNGTPVRGQNYAPSVYVIIRWPFIVYLATQVALSMVLLAWIMLDTRGRKVGIVKKSALSTIFALTAEDRAVLQKQIDSATGIGDYYERRKRMEVMRDVGDSTRVHLVKGNFGMLHLKLAS